MDSKNTFRPRDFKIGQVYNFINLKMILTIYWIGMPTGYSITAGR